MPKLRKMYYITSLGEKKLNCYTTTIPKVIVDKTDIEEKNIRIYAEDNKIIIEKDKK